MRAGIALGSNVGDRLSNLRAGRERLLELHHSDAESLVSSIYETDPVDCAPGTPSFLNAVMEIETDLGSFALLDQTQRIELDLGRPANHAKNSPRTLDVDLLYLDDHIIESERLTLPHPRAIERRFVLEPLCEIRPDLVWPRTPRKVAEILLEIGDDSGISEFLGPQW